MKRVIIGKISNNTSTGFKYGLRPEGMLWIIFESESLKTIIDHAKKNDLEIINLNDFVNNSSDKEES